MVLHRTEDWQAFRDYAEKCRVGVYSFHDVPEGIELRISAGRFCISIVFDPIEDRSDDQKKIYTEMVAFCKTQGFTEVVEIISEELFHL